jgi:hypothetical protein
MRMPTDKKKAIAPQKIVEAAAVPTPKLLHGSGIDISLGTQFTINNGPDTLDRYYGDDLGYAFEFFLRIRPSVHSHGAHEHSTHIAGMESNW